MKSNVQILTGFSNGKTYLKSSFSTPPCNVRNITENKAGTELRVMFTSSSPGILDNDEYKYVIELETGSSLRIETQSYQRIFQMKMGASQLVEVKMQPGSRFCFIGHPIVPHKDSSFVSVNKIILSYDCDLTWGEIITCGRKGNGEVFAFKLLHSITEIYLKNKLVLRENIYLEPGMQNTNGLGHFEGFTHQASFICLSELLDIDELIENIISFLKIQPDIIFGITRTAVKGLMLKILGNHGEQLFDIFNLINTRFISCTVKKDHVC